MRRSDELGRRTDVYFEKGSLVMWRWLGFDRFFPPGSLEQPPQKALRGCASVCPITVKIEAYIYSIYIL
jgi:polycomb protein EED